MWSLLRVELIFIILGFHICEFAYSLMFICNPQINTFGALAVTYGQSSKKCESPDTHVPSTEGEQGKLLPSYFSSHTVHKHPFWDLFSVTFIAFCE